MKYCSHCGTELLDEAVVCIGCGCSVQPIRSPRAAKVSGQGETSLQTVTKVFMIISAVIMGFAIIPICWCLPMTLSYCEALKTGKPISTGFKVCTLLFVGIIPGILMLCDQETPQRYDEYTHQTAQNYRYDQHHSQNYSRSQNYTPSQPRPAQRPSQHR